MRFFLLMMLASFAALARDVGVYGPADAPLHAFVAAQPDTRAYDVVAYTRCARADVACLGGVARRAGMDSIVSLDGRVLREVSADGVLVSQREWPAAAPVAAVSAAPAPLIEARTQAARVLFGSSLALLAGAAGTALYATYSSGTAAGSVARALAITGAGAMAGAGLVVALTPSGAAVSGSF